MRNYDTIEIIEKFNPNHDALGRFASGSGGGAAGSGGVKSFWSAAGVMNNDHAKNRKAVASGDDLNGKETYILRNGNNQAKEYGTYKYVETQKPQYEDEGRRHVMRSTYDGDTITVTDWDIDHGQLAIAKSADIDEIEVVEKFNPFHDARGRFASSNGFKSYSANPNTKAGAMAISRSAAAGHMNTINVHRDAQSTGTTIRQNANWLGQGHQQTRGQKGSATLNRRVEPIAGLQGASATGASWQHQNQAQGRTTGPSKQPQQAQQKPAPAKPTQPKAAPQKPAQQPQQKPTAPKKPASDRQPVDGKDISKTFQYDRKAKGSAMDQVTEQQGFKGKPQVIKDRAEFSAAVKDSGIMAYRTVNGGTDVVTGKQKTSKQFADDLKNATTISHNGSGGQVYGAGIYIAAASKAKPGTAPSRSATNQAKSDSQCYGGLNSTTMAMTLHKSAKIGDYTATRNEFSRMTSSQRAKFGNELGAYAASKGYDALKAVDAGWNCDYIMVYNRTKLIVFDG